MKNKCFSNIGILVVALLVIISCVVGCSNANKSDNKNGSANETSEKDNNKNNTSKGTYDKPYLPKGFVHTDGTWDTGYIIKETKTGNEFVWVPCVLDQADVKSGDKVVTFEKVTSGEYNSGGIYIRPTWEDVKEDDKTAGDLKTSVGKFQGFYIARYEAGIDSDMPNSKLSKKTATDGSVKPLSKAKVGVWNGISRETSLKLAKSMIKTNDGVKSTLISGEAWDTTLQWIKLSDEEYDVSNERGNFTGVYLLTGSDEKYCANKVCDMAGNYEEYTTENARIGNRRNDKPVIRGNGATAKNDKYKKAASRDILGNDVSYDVATFRVVLYK